jgi:hypothetical protein
MADFNKWKWGIIGIVVLLLGIFLAPHTYNYAYLGGIEAQIAQLRDGTPSGKTQAAYALGNVAAGNDANTVKIAKAGGIESLVALVALLRDGAQEGKTQAAVALGNVAGNAANRVKKAKAGGIELLVALVNRVKMYATRALQFLQK